MPTRRLLFTAFLGFAIATPAMASPADPAPALEALGFDPAVLVADGMELLSRAPDRAVDGLFQAVHAAANAPGESEALCALFDADADRSLTGMNAAADQLDDASRERFALAVADVLVEATRNPPQPFDADAARQSLKKAGATAAILHEDFLPGLEADAGDARCRSFGMLLDALGERPLGERAAVTRLLLQEGLSRAATALR